MENLLMELGIQRGTKKQISRSDKPVITLSVTFYLPCRFSALKASYNGLAIFKE
jgi:hypothetical protein